MKIVSVFLGVVVSLTVLAAMAVLSWAIAWWLGRWASQLLGWY